jgi:hypothetical protein
MARKKTATVAKDVNDPLAYVREYAPSLTAARASLLPFDDLIVEEIAGPQGDDEDDPYFEVTIQDASVDLISARVTAESVTVRTFLIDTEASVDDEEEQSTEYVLVDEWPSTLSRLWEYMRQLPRSANAFRR